MPLYDYKCKQCNYEFEEVRKIAERYEIKCPKCQGDVELLITCNKRDWFRPFWQEHFELDRPIFVESKRHYKKLCKQYGVTARCLE